MTQCALFVKLAWVCSQSSVLFNSSCDFCSHVAAWLWWTIDIHSSDFRKCVLMGAFHVFPRMDGLSCPLTMVFVCCNEFVVEILCFSLEWRSSIAATVLKFFTHQGNTSASGSLTKSYTLLDSTNEFSRHPYVYCFAVWCFADRIRRKNHSDESRCEPTSSALMIYVANALHELHMGMLVHMREHVHIHVGLCTCVCSIQHEVYMMSGPTKHGITKIITGRSEIRVLQPGNLSPASVGNLGS